MVWGAGNNRVYFASLPHTFPAGKWGSTGASVGRWSCRICWTVTSKWWCSFAPALLPVERTEWHDNASLGEKWQWNGAMRWGHEDLVLSVLLSLHTGLATFSILMCQPRKSTLKEYVWRQEFKPCLLYIVFPRGSLDINLPCFCPWFINISSLNSKCLKVHWSVGKDYLWPALQVIPSLLYLWWYFCLHR